MTTELSTKKELAEKLSSLKQTESSLALLQSLRKREMIDRMLVILLDTSDSMGDIMEQSRKIDVAWKVFQNELAPNMAGWTYGIVMFGSDAWWDVLPTADIRALFVHQRPTAYGMTSMGKALQIAWAWVKSNVKQARFIMLTDGMPNDLPKEQILALASQNNSIPVDCVGIGQGGYDYDPEFLRQLSSVTGGLFCEVGTVKLLAETILKLSPSQRPLLGEVL